jgi:MFS transporter, OFA family, oxalate/formate antiporter
LANQALIEEKRLINDADMRSRFRQYSIGIMAATFLAHFLQPIMVNDTMNIYYIYLPKLYGWSRAQIALGLTIGSLIAIPCNFLLATLIMRANARKITTICIMGMGICTVIIAKAASYPLFLIAYIINVQCSKGMVLGGLQACATWYISKRGRVLGIVTIACPLASAVYTNGIMRLIEATGSFSMVYTVWGIAIIVLGFIFGPMLRSKPEEYDVYPDGIIRSEEELAVLRRVPDSNEWPLNQLFKTKETWFLILGWSCMFTVMTGFMSIFIPRMIEVKVPLPLALNFLTGASLLGMALSYLWGWIDDKKGAHKASIGLALGYLFMSVAMLLASGGNMVFVIIAVIGVASATGGLPNLNPSSIAYVYGRKDFMANLRWIMMIAGGISGPASTLFNWIYDTQGNYNSVYKICSIISIVAIISFILIRKTYDPERLALRDTVK